MSRKRKDLLKISDIKYHADSNTRCLICGETRNVPFKRYYGLCAACWMREQEDDVLLELFGFERSVA